MSVEKINKIVNTWLQSWHDFGHIPNPAELGGDFKKVYSEHNIKIHAMFEALLPVYNELETLTWNNQHSEYMVEVAKFCQDEKYIKIFEHILELHNLDGSLNYRLSQYRDFQWEDLKKKYEEKLQPLGISPTDIENELPF